MLWTMNHIKWSYSCQQWTLNCPGYTKDHPPVQPHISGCGMTERQLLIVGYRNEDELDGTFVEIVWKIDLETSVLYTHTFWSLLIKSYCFSNLLSWQAIFKLDISLGFHLKNVFTLIVPIGGITSDKWKLLKLRRLIKIEEEKQTTSVAVWYRMFHPLNLVLYSPCGNVCHSIWFISFFVTLFWMAKYLKLVQ